MSLVLGLDTGGTFTDAALLDTTSGDVLATAKALTTRADLSVGVGGAIAACLTTGAGRRRASAASACPPPWPQMPWLKGSADGWG